MSHQMDCKNGCHGKYSFRVFGMYLFNKVMNIFGSRWFIAITGEIQSLVWIEAMQFYFSAVEQNFHLSKYIYGFARCSFCC